MVQREGRIIRPGNTCEQVYIYRYIVEKSFDAYSWQIIETKQTFISTILNNKIDKRDGYDVDDSVLNYAEIKALAIGNETMRQRTLCYNELCRLKNLRRKEIEEYNRNLVDKAEYEKLIPLLEEEIIKVKEDLDYLQIFNVNEHIKERRKDLRDLLFNSVNDHFNSTDPFLITNIGEFSIYVPAFLQETNENLALTIGRSHTYELKVLNNLNGMITRLENFFEGFETRYNDLLDKTDQAKDFLKKINKDLKKRSFYEDEIEKLKEKLIELDKELGINDTLLS